MPGPSLQPTTKSDWIQIAGTDVRPTRPPSSARSAGPSETSSSSTTVYFAPFASRSCFALTQNGHRTKDSMSTGSPAMRPSSFARTATSS